MLTLTITLNTIAPVKYALENSDKCDPPPKLGHYFQGDSLSSISQERKCLPKQEGEVPHAQ